MNSSDSTTILHITNGDSCADALKETSLAGDVLPWRDVLHDGPVPGDLELEALSKVRSQFLADYFELDAQQTHRDFVTRDALLANAHQYEEVRLWFEHDLYDQLQILQLLDHFSRRSPAHPRLTMICINHFPGIEPFHGLGQLSPEQLQSLDGRQQPVTREQLNLGSEGWRAFTSSNAQALFDFCSKKLSALPFMRAALLRLLEEFPSNTNGLSRTQHAILSLIESGHNQPKILFPAFLASENAPFMGDWSFFQVIRELGRGDLPAITADTFSPQSDAFITQTLHLTEFGHSLLKKEVDWVQQQGIDRWIGGTHLAGRADVPRWIGELPATDSSVDQKL